MPLSRRLVPSSLVALVIVGLAACGSGGGSGTSIPESQCLAAFAPATVAVGSVLSVDVSPDNCPVSNALLTVNPMPLPANASFDAATGVFRFAPNANQVGHYAFSFTAASSGGSASRTLQVTVPPVVPGGPTQLRGFVLDADTEAPLMGAIVALDGGTPSTATAADGSFVLSGLPSGPVSVLFDGRPVPDGDYPFLPEPFDLIAGVPNVLERAVYLPFLHSENAVPLNPNGPTMVTSPLTPGIGLMVAQASATTPDGRPFTGGVNIAPVPPDRAPRELPRDLAPGRLISIQPGGVQFDPPAAISWPNDDGLAPGTLLNIWSVDPALGTFVVVGQATVQPGGTIETTSGGIQTASWHALLPLQPDGEAGPADPRPTSTCAQTGSMADVASGILHETHTLPPTFSLGRANSVTLHYNSATADTRPIILTEVTIPVMSTVPRRVSSTISVDACDIVDGTLVGTPSFLDTHLLSETVAEHITVATQVPWSNLATGMHAYCLELRNHFTTSSIATRLNGTFPVVNRRASPVGVGWAIEELGQVIPQSDGTVLLVDGDGHTLRFSPAPGGASGLVMTMFDQVSTSPKCMTR